MSEYGKRLVEAGVGGYERVFDVTTIWRPEHRERAMRLALLAFLDKLAEEGPSEGMIDAALRERFDGPGDSERTFTAMLRHLRGEIEEG